MRAEQTTMNRKAEKEGDTSQFSGSTSRPSGTEQFPHELPAEQVTTLWPLSLGWERDKWISSGQLHCKAAHTYTGSSRRIPGM